MKRYDILYEENCQQLEEIEKKMWPKNIKSWYIFDSILQRKSGILWFFQFLLGSRKFMEEEIIKDEEELEKLEVEYGTDDDDDNP